MNILILVIANPFFDESKKQISDIEKHYLQLKQTQKKTWNSILIDEIKTFYLYNDSNILKSYHRDDNIFLPHKEKLMNIGYKTISAFEYILNKFNFDYVFRTNLSSYINKTKLYTHIKNTKPNYSGVIGEFNGIKYCSGSGYTISKETIEKVVENKNMWNHNYIDDVSLGKLLTDLGYFPEFAERFDIINRKNILDISHFHYRIKFHMQRHIELEYHNRLHNLILEKNEKL